MVYENLPLIIGTIQILGAFVWIGVGCVMNRASKEDWKIRAIIYAIIIGQFWTGCAHLTHDGTLYWGVIIFALSVGLLLPIWIIYFHNVVLTKRISDETV